MKCNFVVGQKVVFVGAFSQNWKARAAEEGVILPVKGVVYTIRGFDPVTVNGVFIWLNEIRNDICIPAGREYSFAAEEFRPVVDRKTDISVFKAMLTPAGRIPVDA